MRLKQRHKCMIALIIAILFYIYAIYSGNTGFVIGAFLFLFGTFPFHDLEIKEGKYYEVTAFKQKELDLERIEILTIKIKSGPCFSVTTKDRYYAFCYTKENYENLKHLMLVCKSSKVSPFDLEETVNKYIFGLPK